MDFSFREITHYVFRVNVLLIRGIFINFFRGDKISYAVNAQSAIREIKSSQPFYLTRR